MSNTDERAALERIANMVPAIDSIEGDNEWGAADCFRQAQSLACKALAALSAAPAEPAEETPKTQAPCGGRSYCGRFPFCGCGGPDPLPERDPSKPAEQQGVFRKFEVCRVDGSDKPGGKHEGCEYFVLDVDHDPHAKVALAAYAGAVEATHPQLAEDMRDRYDLPAAPAEPLIPIAPDSRKGKPPCGECHLQPGETCDICGACAAPATTQEAWTVEGVVDVSECGIHSAGIDSTINGVTWGRRITCCGRTADEAVALRDRVLRGLSAAPAEPAPSCCTMTDQPCTRSCGLACALQMEALAAAPPPQPAAIERLTDAQIDALDTFALHCMAPQGRASVREFARAIERELSRVPDGASCPHEAEPRGCYRVRCQLGRKCVEAAAPTPGSQP